MPSPFPGMNPYLEQEDVWSDFHNRFVIAAAEAIGPLVRPAYIVKVEQNAFVEESGENGHLGFIRPDVFVAETRREPVSDASGVALAIPSRAVIVPALTPDRDPFIEIRDIKDRKLITAIELLSPSNKEHGPTRAQYIAKRTTYFKSGVNLVEIDLLRAGPRMPLAPKPEGDYCVMVSRAEDRPEVDVWSIRLRQSLPTIPVPLRSGEPDAPIHLQTVLHRVYDGAGYSDYIYRSQPEPALTDEDRKWAEDVLRANSAGRSE